MFTWILTSVLLMLNLCLWIGNICNGMLLGNASIARGLTCCKKLARHEASRKSLSTKFPLGGGGKPYLASGLKREYVEPDALKEWKVSIFKIVDQRIKFYSQNTNLLPPKPKSTFRHLKQGIQDFHRMYVLVPADKAVCIYTLVQLLC